MDKLAMLSRSCPTLPPFCCVWIIPRPATSAYRKGRLSDRRSETPFRAGMKQFRKN